MQNPWQIQSRSLPHPQAASEALRMAIAERPAPDIAAVAAAFPEDLEQGRQAVATINQQMEASTHMLLEALSVTLEEKQVGTIRTYRISPNQVSPQHEGHHFIHLHGGAYVLGAGLAGASEGVLIAGLLGIPVTSIDYRMPPDDPFPTAVEDASSGFRSLLEEIPDARVAMGGTSAGGGLTLAVVQHLIQNHYPIPAALFLGSPWGDLTPTGDTLFTNEGIDHVLVTYRGILEGSAQLYAGSADLKHPLISPLYGDFSGFPPAYLVSGTRDLFLSDTCRVHRKLITSGSQADLHVYEGLSHGEYLFDLRTEESRQVFHGLSNFLGIHLA